MLFFLFVASQIYNANLYLPNYFFATYQLLVKFSKIFFNCMIIKNVNFCKGRKVFQKENFVSDFTPVCCPFCQECWLHGLKK